MLATLAGEKLTVSGDARCDSPRHCATFHRHMLLHSLSHPLVVQDSIHVAEVKNSYWLELEGLERCLCTITRHDVHTAVLGTDRHPGMKKMMHENYGDIKHEYDLWHIQRGVKKKLLKCKISELLVWVQAIVNHLWYCAATCDGDPLLLKEKWISILNITNRHHWHFGERIESCEYVPYTRGQANS